MNILITGAKGQLGTELCRQLAAGGSALGPVPAALAGAAVTAADIDDADLSRLNEAMALVQACAPDVVINCAAYTNVDGAEKDPDTAFAANALAPRNLALACRETGAKMCHVSTDYVFGGTGTAPYTEAEPPAPASVYGRTKLLGEGYVRAFCERWFIVRTSWLYARTGGNFVKTMLRLADTRPEINVVDDQVGSPTYAEDLAHHVLKIAATNEYGLYHCTGQGICSWYAFACEIMRLAGKGVKVTPCTSARYAQIAPGQAPRPAYSALAHTMLRATVGDEMRPWQDALAAYFRECEETT